MLPFGSHSGPPRYPQMRRGLGRHVLGGHDRVFHRALELRPLPRRPDETVHTRGCAAAVPARGGGREDAPGGLDTVGVPRREETVLGLPAQGVLTDDHLGTLRRKVAGGVRHHLRRRRAEDFLGCHERGSARPRWDLRDDVGERVLPARGAQWGAGAEWRALLLRDASAAGERARLRSHGHVAVCDLCGRRAGDCRDGLRHVAGLFAGSLGGEGHRVSQPQEDLARFAVVPLDSDEVSVVVRRLDLVPPLADAARLKTLAELRGREHHRADLRVGPSGVALPDRDGELVGEEDVVDLVDLVRVHHAHRLRVFPDGRQRVFADGRDGLLPMHLDLAVGIGGGEQGLRRDVTRLEHLHVQEPDCLDVTREVREGLALLHRRRAGRHRERGEREAPGLLVRRRLGRARGGQHLAQPVVLFLELDCAVGGAALRLKGRVFGGRGAVCGGPRGSACDGHRRDLGRLLRRVLDEQDCLGTVGAADDVDHALARQASERRAVHRLDGVSDVNPPSERGRAARFDALHDVLPLGIRLVHLEADSSVEEVPAGQFGPGGRGAGRHALACQPFDERLGVDPLWVEEGHVVDRRQVLHVWDLVAVHEGE
mmetsp:Transcript_65027/g.148931  ORF Transcript_65027/g.148931 Transcript_65027/m.148931 type:complete len:598 (+) Transcript_65027:1-1794(+)